MDIGSIIKNKLIVLEKEKEKIRAELAELSKEKEFHLPKIKRLHSDLLYLKVKIKGLKALLKSKRNNK